MAESKPVEQKDVIKPGIFNEPINNIEAYGDAIDDTEKKLISLRNTIEDTLKKAPSPVDSESLKEFNKTLTASETTLKGLNKVQEERVKIQAQVTKNLEEQSGTLESLQANYDKLKKDLKEVNALEKFGVKNTKEANAERAKLNVQIKAARKELTAEQKEILKSNEAYDKLKDNTNKTQLNFKKLAAQFGINSKEAKAARLEFEKFDEELREINESAKDGRRDVGRYTAGINAANKGAGAAKAGFGSLSGFLLGAFASSFNKSRDTARELQGGIERVTNSVRVLAVAVVSFVNDKALPTMQNFFLEVKKLGIEISLFFTDLLPKSITVLGEEIKIQSDSTIAQVAKLEQQLLDLDEQIAGNQKTIDESADSFANLGEKIGETDANIVARLARLDELVNKTKLYNKEINQLAADEAVLEAQIGNSTISFSERDLLIDELIGKQTTRIGLEKELAEAEIENALTSIENDFIRRDLGDEFNEQNVRSLAFLNDKNQADAVGIDNLNTLTEALGGLNQIEAERRLLEIEAQKERLENSRDFFEQELDFTLDISDRQKSINEIRIADETQLLADRQKILDLTTKILDDSFSEQIRLTEDFVKESLKINRGLTDEEAQKAVNQLNLEKLVLLTDEKEIRDGLSAAGITDEITQNRIREIIIERQAATQDLLDVQKDLNEAEEQSLKNIEASIQAQEQDTLKLQAELLERELNAEEIKTKEIIELNNEIFEKKKEALEDQAAFDTAEAEATIVEQEELAAKLEEIESQKNNDIIRLNNDKNDAILAAEKELNEQIKEDTIELIDGLTDATIDAINERAEAERKANEEEIARRQSNIANLEQASKEGQQIVEGQRAFESRKLAEAQVEQKRLAEEEKNRQLGISIAKAFNKAIEDEEPFKALVTALAATGTEAAAVNLLFNKGFHDGTDEVQSSDGIFKLPRSRDPLVTTVEAGEQIWSNKDRLEVGGKSRKEIKAIVGDYDNQSKLMASILFNPQLAAAGGTINASIVDNSAVVDGLKSVKKSIDGLERDNGRSTGALNELIDSRIREGAEKTITYSARRLTKPAR